MALPCAPSLCSSTHPPSSLSSLCHHPTDASLHILQPSCSPPCCSFLSISSSKHLHSRIHAFKGEERKREILENYGLDPSEFLPEASHPQKTRRSRMEAEKAGKGRRAPPQPAETPDPPRTTHRLLQVLGGTARRRKLLSPKGMDVRPMMEVVKGAAFGILQVAGGCPASLRPGGRWLDLYSGTGSVGIEAISRGCSEVHFVEMDPWVVSEVLRPNLECTGFVDNSVIHTMRVESFLKQAEESKGMDKSFDYVSVTPPYTAVDYAILMAQLENSPVIGEDSFILVEYPLKTSLLESHGHLVKIADRRFGRTNLAVYGPVWAQKKKKSK
ncbi:putative rRNA methyltransferase YlbH [Dioscorea cayenensis subsp. rotundata]|uniref:rRNA methyltransferase YlbH n=1 Tax=Dioscorea cayennensis subsp. rotundata TaxID=55577 RepID=A0AB40AUC4_DIOCR|nr:putative rRNA methyltransferase YlbH [Dioscorea cayenensis subsp. rotundata]